MTSPSYHVNSNCNNCQNQAQAQGRDSNLPKTPSYISTKMEFFSEYPKPEPPPKYEVVWRGYYFLDLTRKQDSQFTFYQLWEKSKLGFRERKFMLRCDINFPCLQTSFGEESFKFINFGFFLHLTKFWKEESFFWQSDILSEIWFINSRIFFPSKREENF